MPTVTAVVVGAGHSGLAMSSHLAARSIDHVVLERGEVANSWRTQRWDSLRLLTPNWMTRLPGWAYQGDDPDGYQSAAQVADLVREYAAASAAPVVTGTAVTAVRPGGQGFEVETDRGCWQARSVVLAAGTTRSVVPPFGRRLPEGITSVTAIEYRNPDQLPDGGVLVVGASASGVQIADELQRSGRPVTLAVGEHVRMPRHYRGHDILLWMDAVGILDERWDEMDDLVRARSVASPQLVGGGRTLDLNTLQESGVRLVGRFAGVRNGLAQFSGSLANVCALADLKLGRLLDTIDAHAKGRGERPEPTAVRGAPLGIDLRSGEIRSVVWATGVQPDFSWLDVPVFDHRGRLLHDGGVTRWPGLYVLGLPMLRRRRSTYIDGAALDAEDLAVHLVHHVKAGKAPLTRGGLMNTHPLATSVATAVADRALDRLGTHLTDEIRLRALLPGGAIEVQGRDAVLARFDDWFGSYDTVLLADVAGDDVGDRVLVHYKLVFDPDASRRVLTQTVVCSLHDGLVGRMDLVCTGFREY